MSRCVKFLDHRGKIHAIPEWPKCQRQLSPFLGLDSYYRKFVVGFAAIARPLHMLTSKNADFVFNDTERESFQKLKSAVFDTPILAALINNSPLILNVDVSYD